MNGLGSYGGENEATSEKRLILAAKQISKALQENIRELRETKKTMETVAEKVHISSSFLTISISLYFCRRILFLIRYATFHGVQVYSFNHHNKTYRLFNGPI